MLLDVYVATEHMEELKKFELQDIIEHAYYQGISFQVKKNKLSYKYENVNLHIVTDIKN